MSVGVRGGCRFTIDAKWELRASEEKCFRVSGGFGFAIPIVHSSRHRSILDCSFALKVFACRISGVTYSFLMCELSLSIVTSAASL